MSYISLYCENHVTIRSVVVEIMSCSYVWKYCFFGRWINLATCWWCCCLRFIFMEFNLYLFCLVITNNFISNMCLHTLTIELHDLLWLIRCICLANYSYALFILHNFYSNEFWLQTLSLWVVGVSNQVVQSW